MEKVLQRLSEFLHLCLPKLDMQTCSLIIDMMNLVLKTILKGIWRANFVEKVEFCHVK